jgi:EAL domain-containing protein (putative c-di-GMP-specific phosphodiesterase class I)
VQAICGIGRSLGVSIVAERIETEQQLAALQELGVQLGQGYLLHQPEPLRQLLKRSTSLLRMKTA